MQFKKLSVSLKLPLSTSYLNVAFAFRYMFNVFYYNIYNYYFRVSKVTYYTTILLCGFEELIVKIRHIFCIDYQRVYRMGIDIKLYRKCIGMFNTYKFSRQKFTSYSIFFIFR